MIYEKGMPEYLDNGVYHINGEIWCTLWAYKNRHGLPHNTPPMNTVDSNRLTASGCESILTNPDIKTYPTVKAFREYDLNSLFGR